MHNASTRDNFPSRSEYLFPDNRTMSELEKLAQKTFYFAVGTVNFAVEQTEKLLDDLAVQTQAFVEEMSDRGQEIVETQAEGARMGNSREPRQLWDELLALVNRNQDVADRLLSAAKARYPGHSEAWYLEKVIYDLKRDRSSVG